MHHGQSLNRQQEGGGHTSPCLLGSLSVEVTVTGVLCQALVGPLEVAVLAGNAKANIGLLDMAVSGQHTMAVVGKQRMLSR